MNRYVFTASLLALSAIGSLPAADLTAEPGVLSLAALHDQRVTLAEEKRTLVDENVNRVRAGDTDYDNPTAGEQAPAGFGVELLGIRQEAAVVGGSTALGVGADEQLWKDYQAERSAAESVLEQHDEQIEQAQERVGQAIDAKRQIEARLEAAKAELETLRKERSRIASQRSGSNSEQTDARLAAKDRDIENQKKTIDSIRREIAGADARIAGLAEGVAREQQEKDNADLPTSAFDDLRDEQWRRWKEWYDSPPTQ